MVGGYYVVATLVFPSEPGDWPDFERYYDERNRVVLGFALFAQVTQLVMSTVVPRARKVADEAALTSDANTGLLAFSPVLVFATFPLLIATFRAKNRRTNGVLLGLLVAQRLGIAVPSLALTPKAGA